MSRSFTINAVELKKLMRERGLKIEALAAKSSISKDSISRWMKGKSAFIDSIKMVADTLEVSVEQIIQSSPATDDSIETILNADRPLSPHSSHTAYLSREDADDPVLAERFHEFFKKASRDYSKFRMTHGIMNKNNILTPTDIKQHFESKIKGIVYRYFDLHIFVLTEKGQLPDFDCFYVLTLSNVPEDQHRVTVSCLPLDQAWNVELSNKKRKSNILMQHIVVHRCTNGAPEEITEQLRNFYGILRSVHIYSRIHKNSNMSYKGKGKFQHFHLKVSEQPKPHDFYASYFEAKMADGEPLLTFDGATGRWGGIGKKYEK